MREEQGEDEVEICQTVEENGTSEQGLDCGSVMPREDPEKEVTRFIYTEMQQVETMEEHDVVLGGDNIDKDSREELNEPVEDFLPDDIMPDFRALEVEEVSKMVP